MTAIVLLVAGVVGATWFVVRRRRRRRAADVEPLTDAAVDAFLKTAPPPDPVRVARIRAKYEAVARTTKPRQAAPTTTFDAGLPGLPLAMPDLTSYTPTPSVDHASSFHGFDGGHSGGAGAGASFEAPSSSYSHDSSSSSSYDSGSSSSDSGGYDSGGSDSGSSF